MAAFGDVGLHAGENAQPVKGERVADRAAVFGDVAVDLVKLLGVKCSVKQMASSPDAPASASSQSV